MFAARTSTSGPSCGTAGSFPSSVAPRRPEARAAVAVALGLPSGAAALAPRPGARRAGRGVMNLKFTGLTQNLGKL